MRIAVLITIVFSNFILAQTDWVRWQKVEVDYTLETQGVEGVNNSVSSSSVLSILKVGYSVLISDLDGDNCPFYPTCSSFFVESVNQTNLIKGTLMFVDRFTRDSNLFKTHEHYPTHVSGKLFDPAYNYQLNTATIIYYPREELVK